MAEIQGIELLVVAEKKPDDKGRSWRLRLVQWIIDGKSKSVKLEKRSFYPDEYGNEKMGKSEGFSLSDLQACKPASLIGRRSWN